MAQRKKIHCAKKTLLHNFTSTSQKAVNNIGCIFSQLVSHHSGIPLERYSLKDSVWNSLTSFSKCFLCFPFSNPLIQCSQEKFYKMLILHSKEKKYSAPKALNGVFASRL